MTLLLRSSSLVFNVLQGRLFTQLAKGIVSQLRQLLLGRLERIAMAEYESLGSGSVAAHLITDLDTLDAFIGETLSRFLVALLTLLGTALILFWMHWQLALLILLLNPLVVFATVKLGKHVKLLKKQENDSTARFTQALTETLDAIHEVRAGGHQGYFWPFTPARGGCTGLCHCQQVENRSGDAGQRIDVPVWHRCIPGCGHADRAVFRLEYRPNAGSVQLSLVHDWSG